MELKDTALATDGNLLAYYRFNTGALTTDSSGHGITLTNNNTVGESVNGKYGYTTDFGSSNSNKFLSIASALGINNQTISVPFWFKKTTASDNVEFFMLTDATTNTMLYGGYTGANIYLQRYRAGVAYETIEVAKTMDTNWHHYCVTMEQGGSGGPMILYYDGVNIGNTTVAGTYGTVGQGNNFWIGRGPGNHYMQGYIDDLAVFNKVLSPTEVSLLHRPLSSAIAFF